MKVFIILTITTLTAFILTAMYTESIILSFAVAFISQIAVASVIFKADFGTWNPFK